MNEVCVSKKGRIEIPAEMRRKYGLLPGSKVQLVERDHDIVVTPLITKESIRRMCGMFKGDGSVVEELLRERSEERKKEDEAAWKNSA